MHTGKVVFDDSVAARKWGVYCDTCKKLIGACVSQKDAEEVLDCHVFFQEARTEWEKKFKTQG